MAETKFVDGLFVKPKRDGAPDFVKGSISIKVIELIQFLQKETGEWLNIDILEAKEPGKWYAKVNDWKPENSETRSNTTNTTNQQGEAEAGYKAMREELEDINPEDIPF